MRKRRRKVAARHGWKTNAVAGAIAVAVVAAAVAGGVYYPLEKAAQCRSDEISLQEKSYGPWWCVKARKP